MSSPRADVVAITKVVAHFNDENLLKFKQVLFEQLNCSNESEFICKALRALVPQINAKEATKIKQEATKIAATQQSVDYPQLTLHQAIEKQLSTNDRLSRLPSDTIDYVGRFLNKRESVHLGYLNRQLYIETQKHLYVLKRRLNTNDSCKLSLKHNKLTKGAIAGIYGYGYGSPASLNVSYTRNGEIDTIGKKFIGSSCFSNLFSALNSFCCKLEWLEYVPINILFNKRKSKYIRDRLSRFEIKIGFRHDRDEPVSVTMIRDNHDQSITKFENNIVHFFGNGNFNNINSKLNCIRTIGSLVLNIMHDDVYAGRQLKRLLIFLAPFAHSIHILSSCSSITGSWTNEENKINTMKDFETIFHKDIEELSVEQDIDDLIDIVKMNGINRSQDDQVSEARRCKNISNYKLERVNVFMEKRTLSLNPFTAFVDRLASYGMTNKIKMYKLKCGCDMCPSVMIGCYSWQNLKTRLNHSIIKGSVLSLLNKLFFKSGVSNNHPALSKVCFGLVSDECLVSVAAIFMYIVEKWNKIINITDLDGIMQYSNMTNIKTVQIEVLIKSEIEYKRMNPGCHEIFGIGSEDQNECTIAAEQSRFEWNVKQAYLAEHKARDKQITPSPVSIQTKIFGNIYSTLIGLCKKKAKTGDKTLCIICDLE